MWQKTDSQLYKKFKFNSFRDAVEFLNKVADLSEAAGHHPKIHNLFDVVELWLSTHDAGGVVTEKDVALSSQIDQLLERPEETVPAKKVINKVKLYADGGSRGNPGPSASGFVILDQNDGIIHKSGEYLGVTTNNQAEYQALKYGLQEARKTGATEVDVFMDSLLVINQMKGIYKVKNRDLWPIYESIKDLAATFKKVTYTHVPRELNRLADAEVNEVLDAELQN